MSSTTIHSRSAPALLGFYFVVLGFQPTTLRAQAQDLAFQHVADDRLSTAAIYSIVQDRTGFMWFGTGKGLIRYDGQAVVVHRHEPDDPVSLSHSVVTSLLEDSEGVLWIGTWRGLNRYDRARETFTHFLHDPDDAGSLSLDFVNVLYEDRTGALWIGSLDWMNPERGGLNRYDAATGTFLRFQHEPDDPTSLSSNRIRTVYEDRTGTLWVGTWHGLNRFDRETQSFTRYMHDPNDVGSLSYDDVYSILEDREGVLWVGTIGGGLNRLDRETETFTSLVHNPADPTSLSNDYVTVMYEDAQGVLWVGTHRGGLNRFDRSSQSFTRFLRRAGDPSGLSHNDIRSIRESRDGVLWIGTWRGLNFVDPTKEAFVFFPHDPDEPSSLLNSPVEAILKDRRGFLWVGTVNGLSRSEPGARRFTHYKNHPDDPESLSHNNVTSIYEDMQGGIWVGTAYGVVNRVEAETGRFNRYRHNTHEVDSSSYAIRTIHEDAEGTLWMGMENGICRFDRASGSFEDYMHDAGDPDSSPKRVRVIYEDRGGVLWVGAVEGVDRFDRTSGAFTHFAFGPDTWSGVHRGVTTVTSIYADGEGELWAGTYANGLYRLDSATGTFDHFVPHNSDLPSGVILGIYAQEDGKPWIVSRRQLFRFDPQAFTFQIFGFESGLQGQDVPHYAEVVYMTAGGELFYAIRDYAHLFSFDPSKLSVSTQPRSLVLTDLKVSNTSVRPGPGSALKTSIPLAEHVSLFHNQNDFSIDFARLDFTRPSTHRYSYMLEGYDEGWNDVGSLRRATYTNIDPGQYVFKVKAANSDGMWIEDQTSLGLTIRPPWWRTPWAYIVYGMLVVGGVFVVDRVQRRRLLRKVRDEATKRELEHAREIEAANVRLREHEEQLEFQNALLEEQSSRLLELDSAKSHFFANISHELRTPLTLTIGPLEDLSAEFRESLPDNAVEEIDISLHNARRLLRLVNQILDVSKLEAGELKVRARRADIVPLLESLALAFSPLAERKQITFQVELPSEPVLLYFDPDLIEKVFTNLLSNAFKFTPTKGSVRLALSRSTRVMAGDSDAATAPVVVTVKDNGPGVPPEELPHLFERFYQGADTQQTLQPGTGIGLSLAKELVELHAGRIEVVSEEGFGTTFTVVLTPGKAHLRPEQLVDGETAEVRVLDVETVPLAAAHVAGELKGDAEARRESTAAPWTETDVTTVLVVDDNEDIRGYVRRHLEPAYRVVEAADGSEGLETARRVLPDLVLSDVVMPEMDGYALCRALREDPELEYVPVILLTARAATEDKLEGLSRGADDYLTKPFDVSELVARVNNLISLRRRLREYLDRDRHLHVSDVQVVSVDAAFLQQVRDVVEEHLADENFGVEELASELAISRGHLHRRLRELVGETPTDVIRRLRLERAAQLLARRAGSVSEIAYGVGFKSVSHFSKCFRERYGMTPRQYGADVVSG